MCPDHRPNKLPSSSFPLLLLLPLFLLLRAGEKKRAVVRGVFGAAARRRAEEMVAPLLPLLPFESAVDNAPRQAPLLLPLAEFESAVDGAPAASRIFFIITRGWVGGDMARETLFLDALFLTQPSADVFFVATTPYEPAPALLASYAARGYALHGVHMPCPALEPAGWWATTDNRRWLLQNCNAAQPGQYFFSHLTDYLRFYLLSRWSGVYTDTDAIFLGPMPTGSFAGLDLANGPTLSSNIDWVAFPAENLYAAPGVLRVGAPLALEALSVFNNDTYDPACFNCFGPQNFNRVLKLPAFLFSGIQLLERRALYPLSWYEAHLLFDDGASSIASMHPAAWLAYVRRVSISVHLFGGMTKSASVHTDSIIGRLASQLSLAAPAPPADDCRFSAPPSLVIVGDRLSLVGAALVYLRDCSPLAAAAPGYALKLGVRVGSLELASSSHDRARVLLSAAAVTSVADVNRILARLVYAVSAAGTQQARYAPEYYDEERTDELRISLVGPDGDVVHEVAIALLIFNRMVTFVTHTSGRVLSVRNMYDSVQRVFPGTRLLASDDAASGGASANPVYGSLMQWVDVPADCGLSFARNALVRHATTPFVQLLDDDFVLDSNSRLDVLLETLSATSFDIASAVIPADAEKFKFHFRGIISVTGPKENAALELQPGFHRFLRNCFHVDFVPNVFMARRAALARVQWDPVLKLGEHEDFFLRAKQAGLRILSCDHAHVIHHQMDWWMQNQQVTLAEAAYIDKRKRVYEFFLVSLKKHGLARLVSFGTTMAEVVTGTSPNPLPTSAPSVDATPTTSPTLAPSPFSQVIPPSRSDSYCCSSASPWLCVTSSKTVALPRAKVGFVTYATGPYNSFVFDLWASIERFAFPGHDVSLFVFTDEPNDPRYLAAAPRVQTRFQARLGWPFDSLGRHFLYHQNAEWFSKMDYLFSIDSDAVLVDALDDDALGERVATLTAWFFGAPRQHYTYDARLTLSGRPYSAAFISSDEGRCYFAGGLFGGTSRIFFDVLLRVITMAREDLATSPSHVALWHDESYLNRVMLDTPPTVVLGPNFLYPEPPADKHLFGKSQYWNPGQDAWNGRREELSPRLLNLGVRKHLVKNLKTFQANSAIVPDFFGHVSGDPSRHRYVHDATFTLDHAIETVTFVIKAFERPSCASRLIASIGLAYPGVKVIVLDDSFEPLEAKLLEVAGAELTNLTYIRSDVDVGLSHGRNLLVAAVTTPYVVVLDDDFILHAPAPGAPPDIVHLLAAVESGEFDIAGGCVDSTQGRAWSYRFTRDGATLTQKPDVPCMASDASSRGPDYATPAAECWRVDSILNFFLARTEALRSVPWDARLKVGEHEDFFLRAKDAQLRVGMCRGVLATNDNTCDATDNYKRFRRRVFDFWVIFFKQHKLQRMQTAAGTYSLNCSLGDDACTIDVQQDNIWF